MPANRSALDQLWEAFLGNGVQEGMFELAGVTDLLQAAPRPLTLGRRAA